jgi:hypothetical protein
MKHLKLVCATLATLTVAYTQSVTPVHSGSLLEELNELRGALERGLEAERTIAAQTVVNHYFYTVVTPKLRTCWDRVKAEGTIEMALTYRKSGQRWVFDGVERIGSSVPEKEAAAALQCMQDSARDTSFVLEEKDRAKKYEKFVLKWTWLVPLPAEGSEIMARRLNDTTEPARGCAKCNPNYPARCEWSKTGSEGDCRVEGPTSCSTTGTKCLTGIYGRAGGAIIIF